MEKIILDWVENRWLGSGGLEAWEGARQPYPEVTGYIIPSLLNWGKEDLARKCAIWLVSIQNDDGSWNGLDGKHHTFDTSAIIEGLSCFGDDYRAELDKAYQFMASMRLQNGALRRHTDTLDTGIYTARASAIVGDSLAPWRVTAAWMRTWGEKVRTHYLAYLLEGLTKAGHYADVRLVLERAQHAIRRDGLMPYHVTNWEADDQAADLCASLQFAILFLQRGMYQSAQKLAEAALSHLDNGGIPQSLTDKRKLLWCAKYALDWLLEANGFAN